MSASGNSTRGAASSSAALSSSSSCAGPSRGRLRRRVEHRLGADVVVGGREVEIARQPPEGSRGGRLAREAGGFRLHRFGGEAPEQRQDFSLRRIVAPFAFVDDFLHERQLEPVAGLAVSLEREKRRGEGRQQMAVQARLVGERREPFPARGKRKGRHARHRQAGQFRQRAFEQLPLAAEQRAQQQGRRQRPHARSERTSSARSSCGHDEAIEQIA